MMRRFFWVLVILLLSVWLGMEVAKDPGYALFVYRKWSVEMPLWLAVLLELLLLLTFYALFKFLHSIEDAWFRWKNWLWWRKKYKAYSKTNRGLIELVEGNWRSAEYYLLEGISQSDAPLINYLAAAKAAHELGAFEKRDQYLQKAYYVSPQSEVVIGLTQARLYFDQGQLEQALATLKHLNIRAPKNAYVLKLLEKIYVRLADWQSLLKLLPQMRKYKILTSDQAELFEANIYEQMLAATATMDINALKKVWDTIPSRLKKNPKVILAYSQKLLPYANTKQEIEGLVRSSLNKNWNDELVLLYGSLDADPRKQLACGEAWLKQYGASSILFYALAKICLHAQLWGKARSYLEQSLRMEARPQTYLAYGKLLEQLGEDVGAMESYRTGLLACTHEKIDELVHAE